MWFFKSPLKIFHLGQCPDDKEADRKLLNLLFMLLELCSNQLAMMDFNIYPESPFGETSWINLDMNSS